MTSTPFPFPLGDLQGHAYALGTTHICIVLPIAGLGMVPVVIEIDNAKSLASAVEGAITCAENVLPSGLGESADGFDAVREAERVLERCGDGAPRIPMEDGR